MARRRTTAESIVRATSRVPWWVGVVLAAVALALLHLAARGAMDPPPSLSSPDQLGRFIAIRLWTTLAYYGQFLIPPLLALGGLYSAIAQWRGRRAYSDVATRGDIGLAEMHWRDFERLTAELLRRRGMQIVMSRSGADGGIDLFARRDGKQILVQCKHWKSRQVDVKVVRELYGVITARGAAGGIVVTSGSFTKDACEFAASLPIELIDRNRLLASDANPVVEPDPEKPMCPSCGGEMVRRTARRGERAGQDFFGCKDYPRCRGTRALQGA